MRFKNYTILFFLVASFWFGSHALATDQVDQTFGFSNYLYLFSGWIKVGQVITPGHNNISKIYVDNQTYTPPDNATVVICSGTPGLSCTPGADCQANIEANLMTCNWSGNAIVRSETITPTGAGGDQYVFTTPVPVDAGQTYFIGFYPHNPTGIVSMYNSAGGNSGMILNDDPPFTGAQMGITTYYSDTYTPPPSAPQFTIQLLTPATTTPFTTYYLQPASFTFNYLNPINWFYQIIFNVKRKADARASA